MKAKKLIQPLTALVCGAILLACASVALRPLAAANLAEEQQEVMELLLPDSGTFVPETYSGEDTNITGVFKGENGYVVETTVTGYVDDMTIWIGINNDGIVTGVTVRSMAETWGLGRKALTELPFLGQFLYTTGDAAVGENVDALTGATVTSKAVVKAVNSAAAFVTGADVVSGATEWGG